MDKRNKKKIIFAITRSHWGGAQRYLHDIAIHLPKNEFYVQAVMGNEGMLAESLRKENIPVHTFQTTRGIGIFQEIKTFFALWELFRNEKPDIVHLNSSKMGGLGAFAARLAGVPRVVFTAHGWAFHENRPFWQTYLILFSSWASSLLHHAIICVSDYDKRAAKRLPFAYKKCVTIKNAVREPVFLEKKEARGLLKKEYGVQPPAKSIWVGTIAELTKNKGILHLIHALGRIPERSWTCVIIGEGEKRQELRKKIARLGLEKNIFLAGHIKDAPTLLKAFDIFVLPSIKEGFPYALLEAGSARLPVIASEVGGVPEIIHGGKTGLLTPPKNEYMLTSHIQTLMDNAKLRNHFGTALNEKIGKEFRFDTMLAQTIEAYKK
ncbi:MAG: glycosyltransferase family 4 protein [bacterium]|nr:glycosyltransferase family 4 protein [bacterium]